MTVWQTVFIIFFSQWFLLFFTCHHMGLSYSFAIQWKTCTCVSPFPSDLASQHILHPNFFIFYCEKWIRFGEIIILPAVPKVWQVLPNSFYTAPFSCSSLLFKVWCFLLLSTLLLSSLFFKLLCCFLITGPVLLDSALKLFKQI